MTDRRQRPQIRRVKLFPCPIQFPRHYVNELKLLWARTGCGCFASTGAAAVSATAAAPFTDAEDDAPPALALAFASSSSASVSATYAIGEPATDGMDLTGHEQSGRRAVSGPTSGEPDPTRGMLCWAVTHRLQRCLPRR